MLKRLKNKIIDFLEDVGEYPYSVINTIRVFFINVKRCYEYAKFGYNNYDFDGATVYNHINFKLKRVKKDLVNGYAIHDKKALKALDECIIISKRLYDEDYEKKYRDRLYQKWGEPKYTSILIEDDGRVKKPYYKLDVKIPNVKTEKDEKQYYKELIQTQTKAEKDYDKDLEKLFQLFSKYARTWWD